MGENDRWAQRREGGPVQHCGRAYDSFTVGCVCVCTLMCVDPGSPIEVGLHVCVCTVSASRTSAFLYVFVCVCR